MFASEFSDHYTVFIPEFSDPYAVFVLVLYLRMCLHQSFLITIYQSFLSPVFVLVLYLGLCVFTSEFPDHYTVFMPEFSVPYTIRIHARVFCPLHHTCSCQSFLSLTPYVFMPEFSVPCTPYVFMLALHPSLCMYLQV